MDTAPTPKPEFRTIAHSGGKVTITVSLDPATGYKRYQLQYTHCRPNVGGFFAVYALPPGIVISQLNLGGIGSPIDPPPIPGCYQVFVGSDSEGKYGRECLLCSLGEWHERCTICQPLKPAAQSAAQLKH